MSARLYPQFFSQLANQTLDWADLTPRALLLSAGFVYDPLIRYRDEIDESFVIATSEIATGLTYEGGLAGGLPFEWLQIADNRDAHHIVIFDDTGDDPYSELLVYLGEDAAEGLPAVMAGEDYFLYPVQPPGGYFEIIDAGEQIGPVNTYPLAYNLALGEGIGGALYSIPLLVFGRRLRARERICLLPDVLDADACCAPELRSTQCD